MVLTPVEFDIVLKLVLAAILGAAVGWEREAETKPAGLRTHTLVCMGAALFTIMSLSFEPLGANVDSSRIAAGIVTGIGFLGAGVIFQAKERVHGLTTAAELWTLAAIGIAVALNFFATAVVATIIIIIILVPAKHFEKRMIKAGRKKTKKTKS